MELAANPKKVFDRLYLLSMRDTVKSPAMCCIIELEDIFINDYSAKLITLGEEIKAPGILFITAISIHQIEKSLKTISLSKFNAIYAYVFDAFGNSFKENLPQWRKNISRHHHTIRKITHLFVPFKPAVYNFHEFYQIPVSYIPLGADVVNYGGYDDNKIIDINAYGRQPTQLTQLLSERFNNRESKRVFLHTNHAGISEINDTYQHRKLFWKLLRKSQITLLFDALHTPENRNFPFSFVPQRMFESAAAGCVVVGKRPSCPEMDELFNWPNSMIELPDESDEMVGFLENLLDNYDLDTIGRRNYEECLQHHDWRHRINDMLKIMISDNT